MVETYPFVSSIRGGALAESTILLRVATAPTQAVDSGLAGLVLLLRFLGIATTIDQVRHQYAAPGRPIDAMSMLRCAKSFGLKARSVVAKIDRLPNTPLPAIASLRAGGWIIVARATEGKILVQDPVTGESRIEDGDSFSRLWTGELILMARRATIANLSEQFGLSWFVGAVHKYRHILSEVLVASLFLQILGLISPLFFQVIVDKVLTHRGTSTLDVLLIGLLTVGCFEAVLGILRTYLFSHTTNRIDVELGAKLFRHLLCLPMAWFGARRAGETVARMREIENIRQFVTGSALTLVMDLLFTIVFLAVMAWYSTALTAITLAAFPFYIGLTMVVTPLFRKKLDEKFKRNAENQSFLVEAVTGVETIKAMAVEPLMQRHWEEQLASYVDAGFAAGHLGNWASQSITLISKISAGVVLWFGAHAVMRGEMSVGELCAFNMLAQRVTGPVLRLAQMWQDFQQVRVSIDRVGDILNARTEPAADAARSALPEIKGAIAFENIRFRYRPDGRPILDDVNLSIEAGQIVGIVGSSGSGKSTLTKLAQRLYLPEQGRVMVDGVDLAMVDTSWLRRQIGVVLQENLLFNRTIRENIALADPALPMEAVMAAASLAGAHEFITQLPDGYDTKVGERGAALSGGQRQRIAIARALIGNPRILIFDEATSALDYESEKAIHSNMRQICHGRTVLIIAHRLSAVRHADRIITIEKGRIVEDGNHVELLRANGRYAQLHRVQNEEAANG